MLKYQFFNYEPKSLAERIAYVIEEKIGMDFKLILSERKTKRQRIYEIPKSFFSKYSRIMIFDDELTEEVDNIELFPDERDMNEVIFGGLDSLTYFSSYENVGKLFRLFCFFRKMKMIEHMLVFCNKVRWVNLNKNVNYMEEMFLRSIETFEDRKKKEFTCCLTYTSFVMLNKFYKNEKIKKKRVDLSEYKNEWLYPKSEKVKHHWEFEDYIIKESRTFRRIYKLTTAILYKLRDSTNLKLKCKDEENNDQFIPVHKEVLLIGSNFFYQMIKFPGIESEDLKEKNIVEITTLNYQQLQSCIEYIYTAEMEEISLEKGGYCTLDDLHYLIRLYIHAEMFFESKFKKYLRIGMITVVERMCKKVSRIKVSNETEKLLSQIPEKDRRSIKSEWYMGCRD